MYFSECVGAAENCCLQASVLVGRKARVAEELCQRLSALGESIRYERAGEWFISVSPHMDCQWDNFLLSLQKDVDDFNKANGGRAELFETRLADPCRSHVAGIGSFSLFCGEKNVTESDEIWLDSGFAFGSGSHPSTRLAVMLLEETAADNQPVSVLDVGCGSGLLSLISARLGALRVVGVDVCADALKAARYNVLRNNLLNQVAIIDTPLHLMSDSFDLILANVTLATFYSLHDKIKCLRAGQGRLIVSGFQGRQADEAGKWLIKDGWLIEKKVCEGKWQAMLCQYDS